jgi:hypothetical protein
LYSSKVKADVTILDGEPPAPTFRSIFAGIAATVLLLLAFLKLPILVKYTGAVFAFIPGKIGLMQVVQPEEVMPIDLSTSPTPITFPRRGNYAFFTDDYDLLVINDAILASGSKPWLKFDAGSGDTIQVNLVSRGMAFYDTVFAKGRPAATFTVESPGTYVMLHPTRPVIASIVPDYTSGNEKAITFVFIAEAVILILAIRDIRSALRSRKGKT